MNAKTLLFAALLAFTTSAVWAQTTFTNIVDSSSPIYSGFLSGPSISAAGTVGFQANLDAGGTGLFISNGTTTTTIAQAGGAFSFTGFGGSTPINTAGEMGFWANSGAATGVYIGNGTTTKLIGHSSYPVYSGFGNSPSLNEAGTLGFTATIPGGGGSGVFAGATLGTTRTIALSSGPTYSSFAGFSPAINAAGTLVFRASLDAGGEGLFTSDGTTTTTVALSSGPVYSDFGFFGFLSISINSAGAVGFYAALDAGGSGLFINDGTNTTTVALSSESTFSSFLSSSLNAEEKLAFSAGLGVSGGGLFIGDGTTTTQLIRNGDELFGSTVSSLGMGRDSFNDAGQLAFSYLLADGRTGIAVANTVPEPSTWALIGLGIIGLLALHRKSPASRQA